MIFQEFKSALEQKKLEYAQCIWEKIKLLGTPLIEIISKEFSRIIFIFEATYSVENVLLLTSIGDLNIESSTMKNIQNSNFWYQEMILRNELIMVYQFFPNGLHVEWSEKNRYSQLDVNNTQQYDKQWSILILSQYQQDPLTISNYDEQVMIEKNITDHHIYSNALKEDRFFSVYTNNSRIDSIWFILDGHVYLSSIPVPIIIENLHKQGKPINPLIVFIEQVDRRRELGCSKRFSRFLCEELFPWIVKNYNIKSFNRNQCMIAGSSLGGLSSIYTALTYPEIIGKVLSQSGAFWWKPDTSDEWEWLTHQSFHKHESLPQEFYLSVGSYEDKPIGDSEVTMITSNRKMEHKLSASGYKTFWEVFIGGHHTINWANNFSSGVKKLFVT
ncbi:esterase family protein [Bacillus sp. SRB3LM]|uniref:alpha/beta hydrolase n=1 Tax=Bacillus sp. SRB3LM TaxID=2608689 RepID=UPI0018C43AB3|nr:alpha/beta hydrolase-fold protein [Bacillus sp. SRB3LM]MBG0969484.1 esterase family protein [Bacillus sp. SRB3LM]MBG0971969.1 esterase family protein [Bacillus sp. SRB3LM]MBG0971991.1 esterase family protein [Bacillus sp. SRB3LM]